MCVWGRGSRAGLLFGGFKKKKSKKNKTVKTNRCCSFVVLCIFEPMLLFHQYFPLNFLSSVKNGHFSHIG